ncbi:hypothetical protein TRVL_09583 [Trypanosoma vivax]|nr:hypothetical protein TRVL_09583 [Trypanosoma vivax]
MPFTVVEENPTGLGRRFVAWPKGKNAHGDCEAKASQTHVPYHLVAVFGEVSAVFDLKASFFHASLPQGSRASFRCRAETGRLVEATRLPKGYERRPEMLHTVARVLVGDPAVMGSKYAPPRSLKIHVRIDSIRTSVWQQDVEKWGRVVTRNARQCGTALGESNCLAEKCEFIGAPFSHETDTVCLSQRPIGKLREAPPLERLSVAGLECLTSHMVYAAAVRGGALFERYFFLKAVRRRFSKLSRGLLQLNGAAGLPAHAVRQGRRWLSALLGNRPVVPRRHRPMSTALATDASMCG